ncbi:MAG: hypothetical protein RXQ62_06185 [Nitrososphaeria archaeon]
MTKTLFKSHSIQYLPFIKFFAAGRSRIASLDRMMNIFFVYYNGPRSQEGMGRTPSEVIAVVG